MTVAPHCSRSAAQVLEQLGERRVVGDDADRQAVPGDGRHDRVVAADVADACRSARRGDSARDPRAARRRRVSGDQRGHLVGRPRRQRASARRGSARTRGRRAAPAGGRAGRPAAARGRARSCGSTSAAWSARAGTSAWASRPTIARPRPGGHDRRATRVAAGSATTARRSTTRGLAAPASMRRLESALAGVAAGRSASAVGHVAAAVATLAFVPASLRSVRLAGVSVPTSVSLSSPRMNASTRLNAMSSWICCGGLFMK